MWDLSSLTSDGTQVLCSGSLKSYPLDLQGSLRRGIFTVYILALFFHYQISHCWLRWEEMYPFVHFWWEGKSILNFGKLVIKLKVNTSLPFYVR